MCVCVSAARLRFFSLSGWGRHIAALRLAVHLRGRGNTSCHHLGTWNVGLHELHGCVFPCLASSLFSPSTISFAARARHPRHSLTSVDCPPTCCSRQTCLAGRVISSMCSTLMHWPKTHARESLQRRLLSPFAPRTKSSKTAVLKLGAFARRLQHPRVLFHVPALHRTQLFLQVT